MKKRYTTLLVVLLAVLTLTTSCFKDDEELSTDQTCMITSMTLGTLKCKIATKTSDGRDSTYTASLTGSQYPLTIDQLNGIIFNVDSLPVGTCADKIVFSALNAYGTVAIKSLTSETDTIFETTDSTDLRQPRQLTVYGNDGVSRRIYTLDVRVHKELGDTIEWHKVEGFDATTIPAVDAAQLSEWQTWIATEATDADSIPTSDISGFRRATRTDKLMDEIFVVGTADCGRTVIWKRNVDTTGTITDFVWNQLVSSEELDTLQVPNLSSKQLLDYDNQCILVGITADGKVGFYLSVDNGRTWDAEGMIHPTFTEGVTAVRAWVDDDKYLWIHCSGTEETWRGRINRLGWANEPTIFLKSRKK